MLNFQGKRKKNNTRLQRFENRFLYFLSFKSPLTSSYSNRGLINYVNIIVSRDRLIQENKNRILYHYTPGSYAYIVNKDIQRKLKAPKEGPFKILETFTNGTV